MQIALTFDNLGEAAHLERGLWPADAPLGRHSSVTTVLAPGRARRPRPAHDLLVEALSCELYPEAVAGIAARGHELAMHAWRQTARAGWWTATARVLSRGPPPHGGRERHR